MEAIHKLSARFLAKHPREATAVLESLSQEEISAVLRSLPRDSVATVLVELSPTRAIRCLNDFSPELIVELTAHLRTSDSALLLRALPPDNRSAVLSKLDETVRLEVEDLMNYEPGTVGERLDVHYPALRENSRIDDLIGTVRALRDASLHCVFVVDANRIPNGYVRIQDALAQNPETTLGMTARTCEFHIPATMPRRALADNPMLRELNVLPVVDTDGRYIGAIRESSILLHDSDRIASQPAEGMKRTSNALGEIYRIGLTSLINSFDVTDNRSSEDSGNTRKS